MYSDEWLKQGFTKGEKINVSSIVNYGIWLDNDGVPVGVTINFETADDFHYELLMQDWNKFLKEVLLDDNPINTERVFREFINSNNWPFGFEEMLDAKSIEYKKIAFY
jgi:hypothetical protein